MSIEKTGNPLYFMIEKDIREKIEKGVYKEGDLLPTEKSLCEQYKVSRVTVRRAIDDLVESNVLTRDFGKSAAVSPRHFPRELNRLNGLYEELEAKGIKCSSYILSQKVIAADEAASKRLKCSEGDMLFRMERLRYADGVPLCYQRIWLPEKFGKELDIPALSYSSLYRMLEQRCGVVFSHASQNISAEMSSYRISALLELDAQVPMLKVIRRAYMETDECIEYSENYYVSQYYSLRMVLRR